MSKLKTYDVWVRTTIEWNGTVVAASRLEANAVAVSQFRDGNLDRSGEEVARVTIREVRP